MSTGVPREPQLPELRVDARRNQQRILLAAARLLADDPSVSMQRIADEAEVARPTVYRRYRTRESLIEAIMGQALAEFSETLDQVIAQDGDAAHAIGDLIGALARLGAQYPILFESQGGRTPAESGSGHTAGHDTTAITDKFDALIARGHAEGSVRAEVVPEVLRHSLLGALAASIRLLRVRSPGAHLTAEDIGKQLADIIVDGIRPRGRGQPRASRRSSVRR